MKNYKKEIIPEHTIDVRTETTCDLCGEAAASRDNWASPSNYDFDETEIAIIVRQKQGGSYPEGGNGTSIVVDICPQCFKEKLVPFLRSEGAAIEEKEWSTW